MPGLRRHNTLGLLSLDERSGNAEPRKSSRIAISNKSEVMPSPDQLGVVCGTTRKPPERSSLPAGGRERSIAQALFESRPFCGEPSRFAARSFFFFFQAVCKVRSNRPNNIRKSGRGMGLARMNRGPEAVADVQGIRVSTSQLGCLALQYQALHWRNSVRSRTALGI